MNEANRPIWHVIADWLIWVAVGNRANQKQTTQQEALRIWREEAARIREDHWRNQL